MKRIFLFLLVNVLVVVTLSITWNIVDKFFGFGSYIKAWGIDYRALIVFAFVWGMGGSLISLLMSKFFAKLFMGVQVIDASSPRELQFVVDLTHDLARRAGMRAMPEVGYYDSPEINAFATGPSQNNALVAVSTGLVSRMSKAEIEGVLAHEITHITNGDMVTMTLLQGVINAFVMFLSRAISFAALRRNNDEGGGVGMSYFFLVMALDFFLSILGSLVTAYFSRIREFRADEGSARIAGKSKMVAALKALQAHYEENAQAAAHEQNQKAVATLKISGSSEGFLHLFATHPPLRERIENLEKKF